MKESIKQKISRTHKKLGTKPPSNLGKKFSEEHKRRLSKSHKNIKHSKETKEKISKTLARKNRGENNPRWKGGITPENKRIWHSVEMRLWREAVFARDNWTCQKCQIKGGKLHPHHVRNFSEIIELRTSIENGITFCEKCHKIFHKIYGVRNNTLEQVKEFQDNMGTKLRKFYESRIKR